jgi:subtilisin family serine protease
VISFFANASNLPYKEGELFVRFAPKTNGIQRTANERNQILSSHNTGSIKKSYKLVPGLTLVKLPANMEVTDALSKLRGKSEILYVEPNYKIQLLSTFPNETEPPGRFNELWGLYNHVNRCDVHAPEAWDIVTDSDIIVAVLDSGVDYNHPDLTGNMWINEAEYYGQPGVNDDNNYDNDGNPLIDDIYGYDFSTFNGKTRNANPMDDFGHGTHCAGIIGAVGNNGEGIAGVCWNVKIMAVKA